MGLIAVVDNSIPVVPDTGTVQAARLANEITGDPGRWVTLDCQHKRHIQPPVDEADQVLECPTCPPSPGGGLAHRRLLRPAPEHARRARLAAEPRAASKARDLAAEAVTAAGLGGLVDEAALLTGELVASAIRQTDAPVDLTVDTHDDVVRIEVGKVVWCELRDQHGRGA
jgi:hypothetical protein